MITDHRFKAIRPFGDCCWRCGLDRGEHFYRPDAFEEADELDLENCSSQMDGDRDDWRRSTKYGPKGSDY